jgi:hypothetical protein
MSRARFLRRLAAVTGTVTAAVLTAAGTLTPALAASGPSMMVNAGAVNIAVQGPDDSLLFYWAVNGTPTWYTETVAGAGTTFSAPSMDVDGNIVNIAVQGPDDSLLFYWAVNGTPTWHAETVAGAGTTFSAPSMATDGNSVDIAAVGPGNSLDSYYAVNGSSTWTPEVVTGAGFSTRVFSAPAIVITGGNVDIAAEVQNEALYFWSQPVGGAMDTWKGWLVGSTSSAPSMIANDGVLNISTTTLDGGVLVYWANEGSVVWGTETVSTGGLYTGTSIAADSYSYSTMIAATASDGHLEFFSAGLGEDSWNSELVSGTRTVSSAPVINADFFEFSNDVNISAVGPQGQLLLDYSAFGSGRWYSEPVPGNGTTLNH